MITLSLCMIIKDEELVLDRCLKSIYDAVDEIIIVDTGSTDNSENIIPESLSEDGMIIYGMMTFQLLEIFLLKKLLKIIYYG